MAETTSPKTLQSIHFLRGLASVMVVLIHALGSVTLKFPGEHSALPRSFEDYLYVCSASVDFFFLISGFTMFYVYAKDFGRPYAWFDFFIRRAIRIIPMYWLISALYVAILLFAPSLFSTLKFQLVHTIESFIFIPTTNSAGENFPVVNIGWTLWYEMYFYLLFGVCMLGTVQFALWAMGILFFLSVVAGYVIQSTSPALYVYLNQLVLEFFIGGLAGYLVLQGRRFRVPFAWALVLIGLAIFVSQFLFGEWQAGRILTRGFPALLILVGLVSLEMNSKFACPRWAIRIGDECYSLYLIHSVVLAVFFKAIFAVGVTRWFSVDVCVFFAVAIAILGGRTFYTFCEKPATRELNRLWRRHRPGSTSSIATA